MAAPSHPSRRSPLSKARASRQVSPINPPSRIDMELPERFKGADEDDGDDGTGVGDGESAPFMQQSVYGMLAAAQPRTNFSTRFQQASGSKSDGEKAGSSRGKSKDTSRTGSKHKSAVQDRDSASRRHPELIGAPPPSNKASTSDAKLAKSMFAPAREGSYPDPRSLAGDPMTQSQFLPPRRRPGEARHSPNDNITSLRADTPMLARGLRALGITQSAASGDSPDDAAGRPHTEDSLDDMAGEPRKSLPGVVAGLFHFDQPEEILAEYECWYLQNVLLDGYMYITANHVCFYAYLQKIPEKRGMLGKQGRHSYGYTRYHFILRGDNFAYYQDASQPFHPLGSVDLRNVITADVTLEDGKETADFTIKTSDRQYYYRADSTSSASDWVEQLRKVIFRSHNDGDSVKISLPIKNILDVERSPMAKSVETVRVGVAAEDDTFAMDEYYFAFNPGLDALNLLTKVTGADIPQESPQPRKAPKSPISPTLRTSTESLTTSSDQLESSSDGEDYAASMSASQILTDNVMFGAPTLRTPKAHTTTSTTTASDQRRQQFRQPPRPPATGAAGVQLPARTSTEQGRDSKNAQVERRPSTDTPQINKPKGKSSKTGSAAGARPGIGIITHPIQTAMDIAGVVRSQSQKMGSYLGTSPKPYLDKLTDAVAGGKISYPGGEHAAPDDSVGDIGTSRDPAGDERRFRVYFGLPDSENLRCAYFCWLNANVPLYGKIYIGSTRLCFRSLFYGTRSKIIVPFKQILNVQQQRGFRWKYPGLVLVLRGHEELFFDFYMKELRADCAVTILRKIESLQNAAESVMLTDAQRQNAEDAAAENELLRSARMYGYTEHGGTLTQLDDDLALQMPPIMCENSNASQGTVKPPASMRIVCLTIGSRGDVQPYIALCKGLLAQGHRPKIVTHAEFGPWIMKHGIDFAEVAGDPAELMRICVEKGMFTPSFFIEANSKFRGWLDGLLESAWEACQDAELLIESPSAMCGIHIAEALGVPYFRAFTMPWSRTRTYPHAFAVTDRKMGGAYNYFTYTLFDNVFWGAIAWQINAWRRTMLKLGPTSVDKMQQNRVPFLYNFSPSVVFPPLDFSDWIKVTGYWFLDEGDDFVPPKELLAFIKEARDDGVKLVYIGFGSVTVADSRLLTQQIVEAVKFADVRCILSKGWSDRLETKNASRPEVELPPYMHQIRSAPHDWLFKQIDAVVIHGGAGTTGAALRAGKPTIIKPFFGDQHFFATRVEDLGVGIHVKKVNAAQLGKALWLATHDARMCEKARILGEEIRSQNGVETAIRAIYQDLEYARTLIKKGGQEMAGPADAAKTDENWTFVEVDEDAPEELLMDDYEGAVAAASSSRKAPSLRSIGRSLGLP